MRAWKNRLDYAPVSAMGCCGYPSVSKTLKICWLTFAPGSIEFLKRSQHRISSGTRRNRLARRRQVGRQRSGGDGLGYGRLQGARLGLQLQRIPQQQRSAQDRSIGIGDAAPGDVRSGSMDRLE